MAEKGLCSTCIYEKECTLARIFPVLECEEFTSCEPGSIKIRRVEQEKMKFNEETTGINEKGLCGTCVNKKECKLTRKFPVLECEEFTS